MTQEINSSLNLGGGTLDRSQSKQPKRGTLIFKEAEYPWFIHFTRLFHKTKPELLHKIEGGKGGSTSSAPKVLANYPHYHILFVPHIIG